MSTNELHVSITRQQETVIVTLVGEVHFDFDTSDAHVKEVISHTPRVVIIEAGQLSFITSVGICFLINLRRQVREKGGTLQLRCLQPRVRKVLEHAHVIHLFDAPPEETGPNTA